MNSTIDVPVSNAFFDQLMGDFTRSYYELLGDLTGEAADEAVDVDRDDVCTLPSKLDRDDLPRRGAM